MTRHHLPLAMLLVGLCLAVGVHRVKAQAPVTAPARAYLATL
jgi:Ca2+/H+ antiporter